MEKQFETDQVRNNFFIYHTNACCEDNDSEFSVELYSFSHEDEPVGEPIKKISSFDELLSFLDENYE